MMANIDDDNDNIAGDMAIARRTMEKNDPRLEKIASYTLATLRVKQEKWQKLIRTDELRSIIFDWLNEPKQRILTINLNQAGILIPMVNFTPANKINSSTSSSSEDAVGSSFTYIGTIKKTKYTSAKTTTQSLLKQTFRSKSQGKTVFYVKTIPCIINVDNFSSTVIFGDLPNSTVKSLAILFDDIFFSLLNNSINRKLWPEIVTKDLNRQMDKLQSILAEVKGEISNRTILSVTMPIKDIEELEAKLMEETDDIYCDEKVHNRLEGMIITWSTQINSALIENSAEHFDINYLPSNEVSYWMERHEHLQNIYKQLCTTVMKKICTIMEKLNSIYSMTFKKIFKNLIIALYEANDISLMLNPFLKRTSALMEVNFINGKSLIPPLIHLVEVISLNSRYYCTTKRISRLLKSICNLLVSRAYEDLELSLLFHIEADEGLLKIEKTIEILEYFKKKILEYREKNKYFVPTEEEISATALTETTSEQTNAEISSNVITTSFLNSSWSFQPKDVFLKLNLFVEQLRELMKIFEIAVSFQNLEKLQIGGNKGKMLMNQIQKVHKEFRELFQNWTSIEIDFMNDLKKRKKFRLEQIKFFQKSELIEKKLATVLKNAFLNCGNSEEFLKLIQISGNIIKRSTIEVEVLIVLPRIFDLFESDLEKLEILCKHITVNDDTPLDEILNMIPIDKFCPPVAGSIQWIYKVKCRAMRNSVDHLLEEYLIFNCEKYKTIQDKRNQLIDNLTAIENSILRSWLNKISSIIDSELDKFVIVHHCNLLHESNLSTEMKFKKLIASTMKIKQQQQQQQQKQMVITTSTATIDTSITKVMELENFQLNEKLKNSRLQMNFPNEFSSIFREIKCINEMKNLENSFIDKNDQRNQFKINQLGLLLIEIPETVMQFYELKDILWKRVIKLTYIVEWYNAIRVETCPYEFILIENELIDIDTKIMNAVSTITWKNYDENFVKQIYLTLKDIYNRVHEIQNNLNIVLNKIKNWIKEPLHKRTLDGKGFLDIENQKRHLKSRVMECDDLRKMLDDMMLKNFQLFFKHDQQQQQQLQEQEQQHQHINYEEKQSDENEKSMEGLLNNVMTSDSNKNECDDFDEQHNSSIANISSDKASQCSEIIRRTDSPIELKDYPEEQLKLFETYQRFIDDLIGDVLMESTIIRFDSVKEEPSLDENEFIDYASYI